MGLYTRADLGRQNILREPVKVSNLTNVMQQYSIVKLDSPQFFFTYTGYNQVTTYSSRSRSTTYYYVVPVVEQGQAVTTANPVQVFVNDVNPGSFQALQNKLNGMQVRKNI